MTDAMTHERCSELIPGIVRGDLTPEEEAAARAHLAGCAECRAELAGLHSLLGSETPAMSSEERDALHRGVAGALAHPAGRSAGDVIPLEGVRKAPLGARWLGAAAAVLVLAIAAAFVAQWFGGGGGDDAAMEGGADSGAGGAEAPAAAPDFAGPRPVFAEGPEALRSLPDEAAQESEEKGAGRTANQFSLAIDSAEDLRRSARTSPLFAAFADAYDAADAEQLADTFLGLLVEDAGAGPVADQIEECGREVLDASPSPILPVVAAHTRYGGDPALVLGFITGESALDRYTVWVWPEGSCARPADSVFGAVRL